MSRELDPRRVYPLQPLRPGDPLVHRLLAHVRAEPIRSNASRRNTGMGRTQTLGLVVAKFGPRWVVKTSEYTRRNPELWRLVKALGARYCPIPFTSVQINQNYETPPHIDRNNVGHSMIVALGDYAGGDLVVEGRHFNIRERPLLFNGAELEHWTAPIRSGLRLTLVFFSIATHYQRVQRWAPSRSRRRSTSAGRSRSRRRPHSPSAGRSRSRRRST